MMPACSAGNSGKIAMTTTMLERTSDFSCKQPERKKLMRPRSSAAVGEIRRHSQREADLEMSDLNWISAAKAHHPKPVLSKSRTDFGVEANSRSTHFHGAVKQWSKRYPMPLYSTLAPVRSATWQPGRNAAFRRLIGLLPRWRERAHSRPLLCELDDRVIQDIGPTRYALLREITMPFWQ